MAAYGESGSGLLIIERILRDREGIWRQIGEERDLGKLTKQMLYSSVVALACYGAVLGASSSVLQAVLSAAKLPLLFLMTLAICLPTLYLFNLVFGARLQVKQALALVMVTITVTSVLSLAFAPISLFFLITAFSYEFYKILNVAILTLTAFVGLRFLTSGMRALNEHTARLAAARRAEKERIEREEAVALAALATPDENAPVSPAPAPAPEPVPVGPAAQVGPVAAADPVAPAHGGPGQPLVMPDGRTIYPLAYPQPLVPVMRQPQAVPPPLAPGERPASMTLLNVWILLFGFVGTQLAWTLRPFVGSPGEPFEIFRKIEGNFYVDIVRAIGELFS
ncbi:hypothetical protein [Dactylosporangium salmoneum]|uniref:Actin-binding WH2 domain-containing protein n=1 Tax=Dactylosporangium salmoneum TaxID=53361 RepID=A0ABN3GG73_9ACTN